MSQLAIDNTRTTPRSTPALRGVPHVAAAPGTVELPGYLYVIGFSNGVVKAGRTDDLVRRFYEHRRDAGRYQLTLTASWHSQIVERSIRAERRLLRWIQRLGPRTGAGREYFHEIPFSAARAQAVLSLSEQRRCPCGHPYCEDVIHLPATAVSDPEVSAPHGREVVSCDFRLDCGGQITAILDDCDLASAGPHPVRSGHRLLLDVANDHRRASPWHVLGAKPIPAA